MTINERYTLFIDYFSAAMPNADTELHYTTTFELLCAVMLSAQCTDRRVNLVTPQLFSVYPTAQDLASATPNDVYQIIRSVSYPNSKAAHLVAMAAQLVSLHNGEVPSTFEALTALPGVGRKTANVVLSVAFGQPRMPVDTHVFRVSHRIGLVPSSCTTPPLRRARTRQAHTTSHSHPSPPLAHPPRPIRLQEPLATMRHLPHQELLKAGQQIHKGCACQAEKYPLSPPEISRINIVRCMANTFTDSSAIHLKS